jgi:hypothetical protein
MTVPSPPSAELHEPPVPTHRVLIVGLVGVGFLTAAFILGLVTGAPRRGFDPHSADGPRALLAAIGLLITGCAVSMRPSWYGGWLCAAVAGLLGYGLGGPKPHGTEWYVSPPRDWFAGVPNSWDSIQLFFGVAAGVGLVGAILTRLPMKAVKVFMLIWVAYHFAGILSAITSPPPTPWMADQYWKRLGKPYLQFAYMNNAYQFYSPDPGPACELWVCLEYKPEGKADDPDAEREYAWIYLPTRRQHFNDPFGLTLYRRLSLTENVAQYHQPGYTPLAIEQNAMLARRHQNAQDRQHGIPRIGYPVEQERREPNDLVTEHVLPSFARHLAKANARPGKEVTSMKIYRVLHLITNLPQFRGYDLSEGKKAMPVDAFTPSLYLPYFQGEFDREGRLKDSTEPLLYWLVPILNDPSQNARLPDTLEEYRQNVEKYGPRYYFTDNVSRHAGSERPVEKGRP